MVLLAENRTFEISGFEDSPKKCPFAAQIDFQDIETY